jgi:hypothetical protein
MLRTRIRFLILFLCGTGAGSEIFENKRLEPFCFSKRGSFCVYTLLFMENVETRNPLKVVQRDCYNPNSFVFKKREFFKRT